MEKDPTWSARFLSKDQPNPVFDTTVILDQSKLDQYEKEILAQLRSLSFKHSFVTELLMNAAYLGEHKTLALKGAKDKWKWFNLLLSWGHTSVGTNNIDTWCQSIMTKYLQLMITAITKRKYNTQSFEFDVYKFLVSDGLDDIFKQ